MNPTEEAKLVLLIEQELKAFSGSFCDDAEIEIPAKDVANVITDKILARYRLEVKDEHAEKLCVLCNNPVGDSSGDECSACAFKIDDPNL